MLPPDGIITAATRWVALLRHSTVSQARALLHSSAVFADLSATQYASALEWLVSAGIADPEAGADGLTQGVRVLDADEIGEHLLARTLETSPPSWLPDADLLVQSPDDLPVDVLRFADAFHLPERRAFTAVAIVRRKVDPAQRAKVGADGEAALAALFEACWPHSCRQVSLESDSFGYDLAVSNNGRTWHVEVKTTSRSGRLSVYLSRHEFEVSLLDPDWRLVVAGLDDHGRLAALATVDFRLLRARAPADTIEGARWESARFDLAPQDLDPGVGFLNPSRETGASELLVHGKRAGTAPFGWFPTA